MIRDTSSIEEDKIILEDSKYAPVVSELFFHFGEAPTIEIPSAQRRPSYPSGFHRISVPQRGMARCDLEAATAPGSWSDMDEWYYLMTRIPEEDNERTLAQVSFG